MYFILYTEIHLPITFSQLFKSASKKSQMFGGDLKMTCIYGNQTQRNNAVVGDLIQ